MNHAVGIDAREEPREYGNILIPASSADVPSTAYEIDQLTQRRLNDGLT